MIEKRDMPKGEGDRRARARAWGLRLGPWGPLVVLAFGVAVFSALRPEIFPTLDNFRGILSEQAILVIAALAVTIPLICNQFDLSIGSTIGFVALLVAGLQHFSHLPWQAALVCGVAAGALVGLVNGWLVAYVGIHSFIATLGTGTVLLGIMLWYSKQGQIIYQDIHPDFVALARTKIGGVQLPAFYMLAIAAALWFVLAETPFGRYLSAIGGNREAAEVAGIRVKRHILWALTLCGALAGVAGVLLVSRAASAQSSGGDSFLLPAFAGAFIGSATLRRGEFHVFGSLVGVYLVATIVTGAFVLGAEAYVSPIISGVALVVAVAGNRAYGRG